MSPWLYSVNAFQSLSIIQVPSTASLRQKQNSSTSSGRQGGSKRTQLSPDLEMDFEPGDILDDEDDVEVLVLRENGDVEQV